MRKRSQSDVSLLLLAAIQGENAKPRKPRTASLKVMLLLFRTVSPDDDNISAVVLVPDGRVVVTVTLSGVGREIVVVEIPPDRSRVVKRSLVDVGWVTVVVPFTIGRNCRTSMEKVRNAFSAF
jgi:hypothetical protein